MSGRRTRRLTGCSLTCFSARRDGGIGPEWRLSAQHVIERDAQRVEIATVVQGFSLGLLRAHVQRRAHRRARLRDMKPVRPQVAAKPEVRDLRPPLARQEQVLGLDVPMDQPYLASGTDCLTSLAHDRQRQRQIERALLVDVLTQVRTLDVLHRDEANRVNVTERVHVYDVGVIELGDRRRLRLETAQIDRLGQVTRMQVP